MKNAHPFTALSVLLLATALIGCASTPQAQWTNTSAADPNTSEMLFKIDHGECTGLAHSLIAKGSACSSSQASMTSNTANVAQPVSAKSKESMAFLDWFNIKELLSRWKTRQTQERTAVIEDARGDVYAACMIKRGWNQQPNYHE